MIRLLQNKDYEDYVELLRQLTDVGEVTLLQFCHFVDIRSINPSIYQTFVYEIEGKIVGCVTSIIEQKIAHNFRKVMHIEDVITHKDYRGKGISTELLNHAVNFANKSKCYKIILDCSEHNISFYEKVGFNISGTQMTIRL